MDITGKIGSMKNILHNIPWKAYGESFNIYDEDMTILLNFDCFLHCFRVFLPEGGGVSVVIYICLNFICFRVRWCCGLTGEKVKIVRKPILMRQKCPHLSAICV
jgi:hypothetical protein